MRMNRHCVLSMLLAGFASTAVVLAQQATRPAGTTDANRPAAAAGQNAGTQHQARSDNWWSQRYANDESRDRGPNFDDPALWRDQDRGQDGVAEIDTGDQNTGGVSSGMVERGTERNRGVFEGSDVDARREYRADRDEFRGPEEARNLDDDRDYQSWRDGDHRGQGMADSRHDRGQGFEGRKYYYGEYRTRYDNHTTAEDYTPWTTNSRDRWDYQTTNETRRPSWSHDYRLVPSREREFYRGPNQEYRSRGYSLRGSDRDRDTYRGQEYTRSDDRDRRVDSDRWDDDDRWDADQRDDETGLSSQAQREARARDER